MSARASASKAKSVVKEPGFEVKSECGRTWFVPMTAVKADYAEYLRQVDGLDAETAMARAGASKESLHAWFTEQFDWADVDRHGRLVKESSAREIKRALDAVRAGDSPGNCGTAARLRKKGSAA